MTLYRSAQARNRFLAHYEKALDAIEPKVDRQFVPTRYGQTHIVAAGPASAPPIIAFQGLNVGAALTLGFLKPLQRHFRIYTADTIGQANFSDENDLPSDSETLAAWATDILDALSLSHAATIGISFGASVSLGLATNVPARVSGLALIVPAGLLQKLPWASIYAKVVLPRILYSVFPIRKTLPTMLGATADEMHQSEYDHFHAVLKYVRWWNYALPVPPDRERLARITAPTLVLGGDADCLFPAQNLRQAVNSSFTNHPSIIFLKGRHIPGFAERDRMNDIVHRFLLGEQVV